jgi:hypothetical protein
VVAGKVSHASAVAVAPPNHEDVARRAYELFEASGRQHGRHEEHWLQAEAELLAAVQA